MQAPIGCPITLFFDDEPEKIQTVFIGAESPSYWIVRLPTEIDGNVWYAGLPLKATYSVAGKAFTIDTQVLYFLSKFQLLFLAHPETFQIKPLRREPRVICRIPATASIDQGHLRGLVTDISQHGCQFLMRIPPTFKLHRVSVLTDINLSLSLHGQSDSTQVHGKVRNTNIDEYQIVLGVEFDPLNATISPHLRGFIEELAVFQ